MADNVNVTEMGWDSGISAEAGANELPAVGEYNFTIVNFEKTFSKSGKPMAKIELALDVNGQAYPRTDYLVLASNMEWKLATFFESLGLKKKGEALTKMPWDKVLGASGRCKLKHEEYNGNMVGRINGYIPKENTAAGQAPTAPAVPTTTTPSADDMPFEL